MSIPVVLLERKTKPVVPHISPTTEITNILPLVMNNRQAYTKRTMVGGGGYGFFQRKIWIENASKIGDQRGNQILQILKQACKILDETREILASMESGPQRRKGVSEKPVVRLGGSTEECWKCWRSHQEQGQRKRTCFGKGRGLIQKILSKTSL